MIQFNLLPDVKLNYLRAKRNRRIITIFSGFAVAGCLLIVGALFTVVNVVQQRHIANIEEDISSTAASIKSIEDFDRIITVQNQLNSIDQLHAEKPVLSRLFSYIETIIPANVNINTLELNIGTSRIELLGRTESITELNRFIDTLKFTDYVIESDDSNEGDSISERAFESVVLESFGQGDDDVSFNVSLAFNPIIFESDEEISLDVQRQITTRSELARPEALFQAPEESEEDL